VAFHPNQQRRLLERDFDPEATLRQSFIKKVPWKSIIEFATDPKYCNQGLYPRQQTLLRLVYLETENMTAYDIEVINQWRDGFVRSAGVCGVQPDIWERVAYLKRRGYRRFPHIQAVLGRRASKGFIGAILAAEQIAYLICLDNPQRHYNIRDGKDIFLYVGATSQVQAQRQQFADIIGVVKDCAFLQDYIAEMKEHQLRLRTPTDLRRIAEAEAKGMLLERTIATIWAVPLSASSVAGRGATSYALMFDEFAFNVQGSGSTKSGEEIYEDWLPSLGQLKKEALTYVPSSPFSKTGKFYELYQQGSILLESYQDDQEFSRAAQAEIQAMQMRADLDVAELKANPLMLIIQGSSWMLYEDWQRGEELTGFRAPFPPEYDLSHEDQQRRKLNNPEKFAVEREGQFAEVVGQYLDSAKVEAIFNPVPWREVALCTHCDDDGLISQGSLRGEPCLHPLSPTPFGRFDFSYRIHVDPSKTGANFALAIAHVEEGPPDIYGQIWPHVIIDRLQVWRARDFPVNPESGKREIDYTTVEKELSDILYTFPSTTVFSADQWNSTGFLQRLRQRYSPGIRVIEETATEKTNWVRAEKFKSAINLGWLHSFRDNLYGDGHGSLLEQECKFLSEKNGKVFKQEIGPVQTKDLYDAVSTVTVDLLSEALERWSSGTMTASAHGSSNVAGLRAGRELERAAIAARGLSSGAPHGVYREGVRQQKDATEAWKQLDKTLPVQRRRNTYAPTRARSVGVNRPDRRFS
jgi:hypothetical protein